MPANIDSGSTCWRWPHQFDAVLHPAHVRLLRFPGIDGVRPTILAQRLETSKQSLTPLLNDLEEWGYLERRTDPEDGRGRILFLTLRGHELMRGIRKRHAEIEQEWEKRLGPAHYAELKAELREIAHGHPAWPVPGRDTSGGPTNSR